MIPLFLLLIFITCAILSLLLCGIARLLFPKFRSGEFKPGPHRSDLPAGGRETRENRPSAPGPHDSEYLFERFIDLMKG